MTHSQLMFLKLVKKIHNNAHYSIYIYVSYVLQFSWGSVVVKALRY
jgi:hypothetical protein